MKPIAALILDLVVVCAQAAEPTAPAAAPATQAAPPANANQDVAPTKEALLQAFDGTMTCSALSAIIAQSAAPNEAWRWHNRSFAFAILARNFYLNAHSEKLSDDDLDNKLTQYANSMQAMPPKEREPFDTGCARRYAQIDKLCEENHCPNAAPSAPAFKPPAGAPAKHAK